MEQFLSFIFDGVDFMQVTPVSLVCIYVFMLLLECVSSIIGETMKGAGLK